MMRSAWRALLLTLLSCAILAGGLVFSAGSALAAEGKRPVIGSMGSGAGGEITVSAHIDPENLETSYELRLECGPEEPMACDELPNERTQGRLPPVEESREVSMTVTGLKPGKYWFGVSAINTDGEASRSSDILTVPEVPPGACPDGCSSGEGFKAVPGEWTRSDQEQADLATAEVEAERQRTKEREEQKSAAEAAVRYASEAAALKKRDEEEEAAAQATGSVALVGNAITVQGDGMSLVKLECLGSATCQGQLTLSAKIASKVKGKKKPAGTGSIGTASFSIAGDETKTVKVKLDAAGRALLKADHGRCSASLAILELAPGAENTQGKAVRLVEQKAAKAKKL